VDKRGMQEWVISLEGVIDNKLHKWLKHPKIENGEAIMLSWQFELTHMFLYVFWHDNKESVIFKYVGPRIDHVHNWPLLDDRTFNNVMDRTGNYAQMAMHRTRDPDPSGLNG
jgi:hypothetical protein